MFSMPVCGLASFNKAACFGGAGFGAGLAAVGAVVGIGFAVACWVASPGAAFSVDSCFGSVSSATAGITATNIATVDSNNTRSANCSDIGTTFLRLLI